MIAQHAIMADLERGNARLLAILGFQCGDRAAAVACHPAQFVQRRIIAISDIAAIRRLGRGGRHQRARQRIDQRAMAIERGQQPRQQQRRIRQMPQPFAQQPRFAQTVTQLPQIAGRAAPDRHPA